MRRLIGPAHAHYDAPCTDACYESVPDRFEFEWRRPAVKLVTSARDFKIPRVFRNRYPGAWIGLSFYFRQRGLALLWGRPGKVRK